MTKLKAIRRKKGITQRELAKYLDVTPAAVSQWEKTGCRIPKAQLAPIAEFFGVSEEDLVTPENTANAGSHCCRNEVFDKTKMNGDLNFICPRLDPDGSLDLENTTAAERADSISECLRTLSELYSDGYLTAQEFSLAKQKILE